MSGVVAKKIEEKLSTAFQPSHLQVIDESHHHQGHIGARPEGETHFKIHIISKAFSGLSRVDCHRKINEILHEELDGPVHALSISAKSE